MDRVVTINTSVRRQQSQDTPHKVKRRVLLLLGELVCCVVPRRSRTRWVERVFITSGILASHLCSFRMGYSKDERKDSTTKCFLLGVTW
jgi:hypothetical protein